MSLLKFKVCWEEDDATYRSIEILSAQTFMELHTCIKTAFQLPADMEASIFVSNDRWTKEKEISSVVEKNLRDAPALSMKKTPIAALINDPHQKFVYECVHPKAWVFLIDLTTLSPIPTLQKDYPICVISEGISPSQFGSAKPEKDAVVDILELYDLDDKDGFGDEGEDEISNDAEEDTSHNDNFTDDL
jgi:hypothetical protein